MHNIAAVLTSIQQLLGEANPDDALMAEIVSCRAIYIVGNWFC